MKTFTIRRNGLGEPDPGHSMAFLCLKQTPLTIPLGGLRLAVSKVFASHSGQSPGGLGFHFRPSQRTRIPACSNVGFWSEQPCQA